MSGNGDKREYRCDACGEYWEAEFFCETCGNHYVLEEVMVPVLDWVGVGPEYEMDERYVPLGSICKNCCLGHTPTPPIEVER